MRLRAGSIQVMELRITPEKQEAGSLWLATRCRTGEHNPLVWPALQYPPLSNVPQTSQEWILLMAKDTLVTESLILPGKTPSYSEG